MAEQEKRDRKKENEAYLTAIRNSMRYPDEVIFLVEADLAFGLTIEQVQSYHKKKIPVGVMEVHSQCLRKGYAEEIIHVITDEHMNEYQMKVALEFYEKGVPLDRIREIVIKDETPKTMQYLYEKILEEMESVDTQTDDEPEYVKELVRQIQSAVEKINYEEKRYEALNEKLTVFENTKRDEEIRKNLIRENAEKDVTINEQQNQINEARTAIARLQKEIEKKDKEIAEMQEQINALDKGEQENKEFRTQSQNATPLTYNVPIPDLPGNDRRYISVEHVKRRRSETFPTFVPLLFKKKSRQDIVKMVAGGALTPAQLVEIQNAIKRGLTESQLAEMIHNNVPAERMKEIIEIAVLENAMQ